jgi:cob(I)alamin adenosyltransferase
MVFSDFLQDRQNLGRRLEHMEITHLVPMDRKGLVLVTTGNSKGKTTTAFGLAVRVCGHDLRVAIVQFMKGDIFSGEWDGGQIFGSGP